jgi:hypothetical protein
MSAKVERWKDRIGLSALFRKAFEEEVCVMEAIDRIDDAKLRAIKERFAHEENEDYGAGRGKGAEDAAGWIEDASQAAARKVSGGDLSPDDLVEMLIDGGFCDEDYFEPANIRENVLDILDRNREAFLKGYTDGFREAVRGILKRIDGWPADPASPAPT